jgi:fucose 4-O-acetylase-like acetyltransferase
MKTACKERDGAESSAAQRVVYLDNLRVLLIVLVVLHHLGETYTDVSEWYYEEPPSGPVSSIVLVFLMAVNQSFFMGMFFLIAGYFAPSSLARHGVPAFVRDRVTRLGVPLALYFFVINGLVTRIGGQQAGWPLSPGPMWFAETLLLLTLAYVAVHRTFPVVGSPRIDIATTTTLALTIGAGSFLIRTQIPVSVWLEFPTIQPAHATQYVCLFAVGIWASGSDLGKRITPGLARYWRGMMLGVTAAIVTAFFWTGAAAGGQGDLDPFMGGWTWQSFATSLWEQIFGVGMIVNLLRAFRERWNAAGPMLSSAAASTYTVYVFHPIVVVLLARTLHPLEIPSLAKVAIAWPIAVVLLFTSAPYLRRTPFLGRVL